MRNLLIACTLCLAAAPLAHAQNVEVNRQNRTIEVTVEQKVSVAAEVAAVTIGLVTHSATHDAAYQNNLRTADGILKALFAAGLSKDAITGSSITLGERDSDDRTSTQKAQQGYTAHQSWTIRVDAASAQSLIDAAVRAGANGIESVEWDVKDPEALENSARTAAFEKARMVATQLADHAGGKLGLALFVSNQAEAETVNMSLPGEGVALKGAPPRVGVPEFTLQLFPQKIERSATVTAVFAFE